MLKKDNLKVEGIHCKSCKILIETELDLVKGVKSVDVNHSSGNCIIEYDDDIISYSQLKKEFKKLGYTAYHSKEEIKSEPENQWLPLVKGFLIPILLFAVILGYILIKKTGALEVLANLNEQNVSYLMILFIGFLASFHCIGMCGGLVVTYTASHKAKESSAGCSSYTPHWQYNLGRLISYTVIGALLGSFGSFFGINPTFIGTVTLLAGFFMVLMGLSLVTNFKWLDRVKLKTPDFIARFLYNNKNAKKPKGPFIIGLLNGFMPCGPLQAMQLYALVSGSVITGGFSMGIYALGTIPLMFGFGSFISLIKTEQVKKMIKLSGIIVVILGLFMFNRGLVTFGSGFRLGASDGQDNYQVNRDEGDFQIVRMELNFQGYSPNTLRIKKDIPVRWIIDVKQMSGCTNEILLEEYGIRKKLVRGENIIEFVPDRVGEIKFSCWMKMVWGKFIVTK